MQAREHRVIERETQMEIALEGLQHGIYISMDHTMKVLRVSRTTLRR